MRKKSAGPVLRQEEPGPAPSPHRQASQPPVHMHYTTKTTTSGCFVTSGVVNAVRVALGSLALAGLFIGVCYVGAVALQTILASTTLYSLTVLSCGAFLLWAFRREFR